MPNNMQKNSAGFIFCILVFCILQDAKDAEYVKECAAVCKAICRICQKYANNRAGFIFCIFCILQNAKCKICNMQNMQNTAKNMLWYAHCAQYAIKYANKIVQCSYSAYFAICKICRICQILCCSMQNNMQNMHIFEIIAICLV
jgi:hypothetical protein